MRKSHGYILFHAVVLLLLSGMQIHAVKLMEIEADFQVKSLEYNVPFGISYSPDEEIRIRLDLQADKGKTVDLSQATWAVHRTREDMLEPRDFRNCTFNYFEKLTEGEFSTKELSGKATAAVEASFTPKKYGFFMLIIKESPEAEPIPLAGAAVVREPVKGFRQKSPFLGHYSSNTDSIDIAGRYGLKWLRGSQRRSIWPKLDSNNQEYEWDEADKLVEAFRRHDILCHGALMPVAFFDSPTIGGKTIGYFGGRKQNLICKRENFGEVGQFGTLADCIYQTVKRYPDVFRERVIRNEPWEGGSISNWHANAQYIRDAIKVAYKAGKKANPDFRVVGTDSVDNWVDQIRIVPGMEHYTEAVTHHPYGSSYKDTIGPVMAEAAGAELLEDESWVAPRDSFIINGSTNKLASGFDMISPLAYPTDMHAVGNKDILSPRPVGQTISTWLHFIEDTEHAEELNKDCLPWMQMFKAREGLEDKHVAVVFGMSKLYGHRAYTEGQGDAAFNDINTDGTLWINDPDRTISIYNIEGNLLPRTSDTIELSLTEEPFYLQSSAGYNDLREKLLKAEANYDGNGLQVSMTDFTTSLNPESVFRFSVENRVLQEQNVTVSIACPEGWQLEKTELQFSITPGEVKDLSVPIAAFTEDGNNAYPFSITAKTENGFITQDDILHVSIFRRGTVTVDGNLEDWKSIKALPVFIRGGTVKADLTEQRWYPMFKLADKDATGLFARFAGAWDDEYFYYMAEIHDPTENITVSAEKGTFGMMHAAPYDYIYWRFSLPGFIKGAGSEDWKMDGVKLAFDVLPHGKKERPFIPQCYQTKVDQRFERLAPDYEYDFRLVRVNKLKESYETILQRHLDYLKNPPTKKYAGNWPPFEDPQFEAVGEPFPEVWRYLAPGVPRHRYYPTSPRRVHDQGIVKEAKLIIRREGNFYYHEAAIPWSELNKVRPEEGKEINFAFFVWDANQLALNWAKGRSSGKGKSQGLIPFKSTQVINTKWGFAAQASKP